MPAASERQARLFRAARAEQKGQETGNQAAKKVARTVSPKKVKEFTRVKR